MHRDYIPISIDHFKNQHYSRTYLFSTISVKIWLLQILHWFLNVLSSAVKSHIKILWHWRWFLYIVHMHRWPRFHQFLLSWACMQTPEGVHNCTPLKLHLPGKKQTLKVRKAPLEITKQLQWVFINTKNVPWIFSPLKCSLVTCPILWLC